MHFVPVLLATLLAALVGALTVVTASVYFENSSKGEIIAEISLRRLGIVESVSADRNEFVMRRVHLQETASEPEVATRVRLSYTDSTTFIQQTPLFQNDVYYGVTQEEDGATEVLRVGETVLVYYAVSDTGALEAYYVITGDPLFTQED